MTTVVLTANPIYPSLDMLLSNYLRIELYIDGGFLVHLGIQIEIVAPDGFSNQGKSKRATVRCLRRLFFEFLRMAEELKDLKPVFVGSHICETRHKWSRGDSLVSQIRD